MSLPTWIILCSGASASIAFLWVFRALHRRLPAYGDQFTNGVGRRLAAAFLHVDPQRLLLLNIGAATLSAVIGVLLTGNLVVAALLAGCSGLLPRVALWVIGHRRRAAFRAQLSDLLMLTAGSLRAGVGLAQAFGQTAVEVGAPASQEIALMLREQRLGATFDEALSGLERRMPLEETALLCAALRISRDTGGNLAETLEALSDAIRRKVTLEGKIRALTAQGRLQAIAMTLLPVLCGLLLMMVEPEAMSALFTTWYGRTACLFILAMQLTGAWFLRRVMRIDV